MIAAVAARDPDILALQEVTPSSAETLGTELPKISLPHVLASFVVAPAWEAAAPRRCGLVIASRWPAASRTFDSGAPWPERILSGELASPAGAFTLHTTHIPPGSSNGEVKIQVLEAVLNVVAATAPAAQILCGDFNVPQVETVDARIVTWRERIPEVVT